MTPLEQQVREALQNDPNTAMYSRADILTALRPLLEQQAAEVATLTMQREDARQMVKSILRELESHEGQTDEMQPERDAIAAWSGETR